MYKNLSFDKNQPLSMGAVTSRLGKHNEPLLGE